ncbi:hypothetical protein [Actinomycetospora sp. NBRC 106378]|uniref:hypothetical protein n=1 Tax=Actinomycetospora sp. NBRC 106378 TaxID=3032208 RepID=UPI0024A27CBC|nr:hypothetical protein [Actinomycetospora sp. NBRC 106378]GLZ53415.1 hypothetical protein Acsp07_30320 [Actinomycetospora sp. NBRC 106378]
MRPRCERADAEDATAELGVPTVRHAAAGMSLTTGHPPRPVPMTAGWRRGETPDRVAGEHPLWPWVVGIGFAFLVGWVIPPPGPVPVDRTPAGAVHELPAER